MEITTTKNVERKIHRQLVLEDGRVVEEEVFIFALFNDNYDMSIVIYFSLELSQLLQL